MGTKGDESNQLIVGQLQILFEQFHKKQIRKTQLEKKLISCAKKTGFINNTYRKQAWKLLINTSDDEQYIRGNLQIDLITLGSVFRGFLDQQQLKSHQYYEQTRLDVIRTLKRFPPSMKRCRVSMEGNTFVLDYSEAERSGLQDELIVIITQILVKHRELHYYQVNFHCQINVFWQMILEFRAITIYV